MSHKDTNFQQFLQLITRHDFEKWVKKHRGEAYTKGFSCMSNWIIPVISRPLSLLQMPKYMR
ncbi:DUF4372 domain-containing protein [Oceanispirochaeta sp.]|jgi:hypothetical protein|uniref:DUF4372 domain-containing protein n=1 Tax=Oceanispirochaeta sp. TaxID=2035350 RepID=UPI00345E020F